MGRDLDQGGNRYDLRENKCPSDKLEAISPGRDLRKIMLNIRVT